MHVYALVAPPFLGGCYLILMHIKIAENIHSLYAEYLLKAVTLKTQKIKIQACWYYITGNAFTSLELALSTKQG